MRMEDVEVNVVPNLVRPSMFLLNVAPEMVPVDVMANTLVELTGESNPFDADRAEL